MSVLAGLVEAAAIYTSCKVKRQEEFNKVHTLMTQPSLHRRYPSMPVQVLECAYCGRRRHSFVGTCEGCAATAVKRVKA